MSSINFIYSGNREGQVFFISQLFIITNCFPVANAIVKFSYRHSKNMSTNFEPAPNIAGGIRSALGIFPYQISIQQITSLGHSLCGGCVVSEYWAATTATCVFNKTLVAKTFMIAAALTHLNQKDISYYRIAESHIHPNFSISEFKNDIAMVGVKGGFKISMFLEPKDCPDVNVKAETICLVAGWGSKDKEGHKYPSALMVTDMSIQDNATCSKNYAKFDSESQLCAGGETGKDTCFLDMGDPLICDGFLYGIASYGLNECATGTPSVFTNVYHFREWIKEVNKSKPNDSSIDDRTYNKGFPCFSECRNNLCVQIGPCFIKTYKSLSDNNLYEANSLLSLLVILTALFLL